MREDYVEDIMAQGCVVEGCIVGSAYMVEGYLMKVLTVGASFRTGNRTESVKVMTSAYLEHVNNVRSATLSMSEDCLYLNIFSPNKGQGEQTSSYTLPLDVA